MDTLTHALAGAALASLLGRISARHNDKVRRKARAPLALLAAGAIAACAPDVDYLLFSLDPPRFLAHWHRGPTHSLVLLPLWAWLLSWLLGQFKPWRMHRDALFLICFCAWLSHIALDLLNSYGTLVLSPFSHYRPALHWAFELDPLLTLLIAALLVVSLLRWWRPLSIFAALAIGLYLGQLQDWYLQALGKAQQFRDAHGVPDATPHAFPQPLTGAHRHLVVQTPTQYCHSYQKLSATWPVLWFGGNKAIAESLQHYLLPDDANWRCFAPFADKQVSADDIRARWQDARLHYFRDFAVLPMVDSVVNTADGRCIWFTDLRYDWPVLPATFRYGFCRESEQADWRFYRLRYLSADDRDEL